MVDAALAGFAALPAPGKHSKRPWWEVLGTIPTATPEMIREAYRRKAREAHPDLGGSSLDMADVNAARDEALHQS